MLAQLPSPGAQGLGLHWSSHKSTGTALRVPHAHLSLALEFPQPCWASVGLQGQLRAGNAGGILPDSGAHLAAWHTLPSCPVPAGGQHSNFPSPSPTPTLLLPCSGNTIPVNFPVNFPASPALPQCVITVPGSCFPLRLPCAGALLILPASQGLGERQLCRAESPGSAQPGLGGTGQLRGHWTAREWPRGTDTAWAL